jgi:hypothetical protein
VAAAPDLPEVLFVAARQRWRAGEMPAAREALASIAVKAPDFAPAVADWALMLVDAGEASEAMTVARRLVQGNRDAVAAHLALAEAERAAGVGGSKGYEAPCRREEAAAPTVRAMCALARAADARLAGDEAAALAAAKNVVALDGDPRRLARAAIVLALLGRKDEAAAAVAKARPQVSDAFGPLAWAEAALKLARGETASAPDALGKPTSPETRLVAARLARAQGDEAVAKRLAAWTAAQIELDPELAALAGRRAPSPDRKRSSSRRDPER